MLPCSNPEEIHTKLTPAQLDILISNQHKVVIAQVDSD